MYILPAAMPVFCPKDVVTTFRNRCDEVRVHPLSFCEYVYIGTNRHHFYWTSSERLSAFRRTAADADHAERAAEIRLSVTVMTLDCAMPDWIPPDWNDSSYENTIHNELRLRSFSEDVGQVILNIKKRERQERTQTIRGGFRMQSRWPENIYPIRPCYGYQGKRGSRTRVIKKD